MKKLLSSALISAAIYAPIALSADEVKIGFVTTLTTGAASIGQDQEKAVKLALKHIDNTMGGKQVNLIMADDGFKPETGKQATDKLVKQDDVDFVAGYIWSHVLLASRKSVLDADKFLISANAGPSPVAGKLCHENFFSTSWQNDQTPMAMGETLNQQGVKSLYVMAPNYAAGKDMVAGVERTFKGEIMGKDMTKWGKDAQLDFSAELAKAKASGAEGIFVFYPGKAGPAFIKQYQQAELQEGGMEGVLGSVSTQHWGPDLDNEANKKFVSDFRAEHGSYPSFYAAQAYDSILLIKSAVDAVNGDLSDQDGMRAAMKKANFASVRGDFTYGNNHMPVQDFYSRTVVEDADGNWTTEINKVVLEDHQDTYAADCTM